MTEVLFSWAVLNGTALFILVIMCVDGANFSFVNPIVIYKNIQVNWFGAFVLATLFNILFPIIAIPYWIYKIFTAGRI